jgi:CRISPR-associated protein Cas2
MYVILVYDIVADEAGAKISRNVFKNCKKYLTNVQKSTFEGEVTLPQLRKLQVELNEFIRKDRDSLTVFYGNNKTWLKKEFWGLVDNKMSNIF